jgi:hypothetical protein
VRHQRQTTRPGSGLGHSGGPSHVFDADRGSDQAVVLRSCPKAVCQPWTLAGPGTWLTPGFAIIDEDQTSMRVLGFGRTRWEAWRRARDRL